MAHDALNHRLGSACLPAQTHKGMAQAVKPNLQHRAFPSSRPGPRFVDADPLACKVVLNRINDPAFAGPSGKVVLCHGRKNVVGILL